MVAKHDENTNFTIFPGNHEFDDGVKGLAPFLRNQTAPCVVSNIDTSDTPEMAGLCQPSVVVRVGDKKVGVIGYLTQETLEVSNPGKLVISDEIEAVSKEAERLHSEGVNIIIGLGHSGYQKDIEIAKEFRNLTESEFEKMYKKFYETSNGEKSLSRRKFSDIMQNCFPRTHKVNIWNIQIHN